jgi:hypothetical protein
MLGTSIPVNPTAENRTQISHPPKSREAGHRMPRLFGFQLGFLVGEGSPLFLCEDPLFGLREKCVGAQPVQGTKAISISWVSANSWKQDPANNVANQVSIKKHK